jgi:hypothetical protein
VTGTSANQSVSTLPPYTIAICKGSALLNETRTLLRAWQPGELLKSFDDRVLQEDILGKTTAYRARDIVRRVFARRYLQPDDQTARHLKRLLDALPYGAWFGDLCLLYATRADQALREVITDFYWPAMEEGRLTVLPETVVSFLRDAQAEGRMEKPWSAGVRLKVARGLLKALTDFGLLREVARGRRETVSYHPTDLALVYLVHDLHAAGLTDASVMDHPDWDLYGIKRSHRFDVMNRLTGDGWWIAQGAGTVVRITWKYDTLGEVVDALAGRHVR